MEAIRDVRQKYPKISVGVMVTIVVSILYFSYDALFSSADSSSEPSGGYVSERVNDALASVRDRIAEGMSNGRRVRGGGRAGEPPERVQARKDVVDENGRVRSIEASLDAM